MFDSNNALIAFRATDTTLLYVKGRAQQGGKKKWINLHDFR